MESKTKDTLLDLIKTTIPILVVVVGILGGYYQYQDKKALDRSIYMHDKYLADYSNLLAKTGKLCVVDLKKDTLEFDQSLKEFDIIYFSNLYLDNTQKKLIDDFYKKVHNYKDENDAAVTKTKVEELIEINKFLKENVKKHVDSLSKITNEF